MKKLKHNVVKIKNPETGKYEGLPAIVGKNGVDGLNGKDGVDGLNGKDGKDGVDGITPTIGENGNWYIGDEDTGKPSRGESTSNIIEFADGKMITLSDSSDSNLISLNIYGKSTQQSPTKQLFNVNEIEFGKMVSSSRGDVVENAEYNVSGYIKITPKTQYTRTFFEGTSANVMYDVNKNFLGNVATTNGTFTTLENAEYMRFNIPSTSDVNSIMLNSGDSLLSWQEYTGGENPPSYQYPKQIISIGDKGTINIEIFGKDLVDFESYEEQKLTLLTPNGLKGIPVESDGNYIDENGQQWISDYIDLERGVYVQTIKKINVVPRVDESSSTETKWRLSYFVNDSSLHSKMEKAKGFIMSNNLQIVSQKEETTKEYSILAPYGHTNNLELRYWILKSEADTVEEAISLASGVVVYPLAEPVETSLTEDEIKAYKSLNTYYLETNIANDENAYMQLKYNADTKAYIDKKISELQTALANTQAQML